MPSQFLYARAEHTYMWCGSSVPLSMYVFLQDFSFGGVPGSRDHWSVKAKNEQWPEQERLLSNMGHAGNNIRSVECFESICARSLDLNAVVKDERTSFCQSYTCANRFSASARSPTGNTNTSSRSIDEARSDDNSDAEGEASLASSMAATCAGHGSPVRTAFLDRYC